MFHVMGKRPVKNGVSAYTARYQVAGFFVQLLTFV